MNRFEWEKMNHGLCWNCAGAGLVWSKVLGNRTPKMCPDCGGHRTMTMGRNYLKVGKI